MRGTAGQSSVRRSGHRRPVRAGLAVAVAGVLATAVALAGPASAAPAGHGPARHDARHPLTLNDEKGSAPGSGGGSASPATAYVANYYSGTVTPIRTATNTAGPPITVGSGPIGMAVLPDGKTV